MKLHDNTLACNHLFNMKNLALDRRVIEHLIRQRFGTQEKFLRRAGIDKSTLGHWLKGEHYPRPETFLRFCGALDVDFFAVMDASLGRLQEVSFAMGGTVLTNQWSGALASFAFLRGFLLTPGEWPGEKLLEDYNRGRVRPYQWHRWEFQHRPKMGRHNYYGTFVLKPSVDPQVWYFAFQETTTRPWGWLPYGCVRKLGDENLLIHFVLVGESERAAHSDGVDRIAVQTYLSKRRTNYRIASLHPFEVTFSETAPESLPRVCFRQPGLA